MAMKNPKLVSICIVVCIHISISIHICIHIVVCICILFYYVSIIKTCNRYKSI